MAESTSVRRVSIRMSPARPSRALAERAHPHLVGAVGLLLLADQVAHVLGIAADGRARTRAALAPDEIRDFVDGGAVYDGRVHGLPQLRRQPLDRGAPDRCGCLGLWGFGLHAAMLARAAHALHCTMVRGIQWAGPQARTARPRVARPRARAHDARMRVGKRASRVHTRAGARYSRPPLRDKIKPAAAGQNGMSSSRSVDDGPSVAALSAAAGGEPAGSPPP